MSSGWLGKRSSEGRLQTFSGAVGIPGARVAPERIVLPALPGAKPSGKPPVRIFLGTEAAQFRAERTFVWSVHEHRDPGRAYEIYLMRNLTGYRRWFWTTNFTNYRFAVPHYAGRQGRAIYNDVDQVYLADPAELFDLDMRGAGILTVDERDTSVMLIDCERMASVWSLRDARRRSKRSLIGRALAQPGVVGRLPGEWNARDHEYEAGRSRLLHFTTLHTQPWRPFPERFVYHEHPFGDVFFQLERRADRAGFQLFGRRRPSEAWRAQGEPRPTPRGDDPEIDEAIRLLVRRVKADSLLRVHAARPAGAPDDPGRWEVERVRHAGLRACVTREVRRRSGPSRLAPAADEPMDGVACIEGLEHVPIEDVPWVVDALFARARRFVFAAIACQRPSGRQPLSPPPGRIRTRAWWTRQFEAASRRHPDVHWQLMLDRGPGFDGARAQFRQGGRFPGNALPTVWVLTDHKPGHATQSVGLAEELGWPYERIDLDLAPWAELPNGLLGRTPVGLLPGSARRTLTRSKPDLVIAAGRRTSPVSRWLRKESRGRTRVVQLGRIGVSPADDFDLTVVPGYAGLLPHPSRTETVMPLNRVQGRALDSARRQWQSLFDAHPGPRIAVLVGGRAPHYRLSPERAEQLGRQVMELAEEHGGSVFVTTSRRTPEETVDALERAMPEAAHFYRWRPGAPAEENPFLGYLALADLFVVTGESASMIGEACATGRPVYVWDVTRGVPGWKGIGNRTTDRIVRRLVRRAIENPVSRRGFPRPQRGPELLLSKLMLIGFLRPPCDYSVLHRALYARGLAFPFERALEHGFEAELRPAAPDDLPRVAARVRALLGVPELRRRRDGGGGS